MCECCAADRLKRPVPTSLPWRVFLSEKARLIPMTLLSCHHSDSQAPWAKRKRVLRLSWVNPVVHRRVDNKRHCRCPDIGAHQLVVKQSSFLQQRRFLHSCVGSDPIKLMVSSLLKMNAASQHRPLVCHKESIRKTAGRIRLWFLTPTPDHSGAGFARPSLWQSGQYHSWLH